MKRQNIPFTTISAAGLHGVGWRKLPANIWRLGNGWLRSQRILRQYRPDVLLFTGGYVAVPMALAGRQAHIPSLLYVPDIEPGLALKVLTRFTNAVAITVADTQAYLPAKNKATVTGYPIRPELAQWQPQAARQFLGLDADKPVLLVTGGSKGARSINRAVLHSLPRLLADLQVYHITGELDWSEVQAARAELPGDLVGRYHIAPYQHEMGAALAAANLALCRAGASTLGELPLFGLPAVLVPYPYAWRYQRVNADYLVRHGAAVMVRDEVLAEQILPVITDLLGSPQRRQKMSESMRALAQPQAAQSLAQLIRQLASPTGTVSQAGCQPSKEKGKGVKW